MEKEWRCIFIARHLMVATICHYGIVFGSDGAQKVHNSFKVIVRYMNHPLADRSGGNSGGPVVTIHYFISIPKDF